MIKLMFGLNEAIPATATTAWGARLIVTQDGYVDFVHDRQDAVGDDKDALLDKLNADFDIPALRTRISDLLRTGKMDTRVAERFTLYNRNGMHVVADTKGSGGYCYVAAFANDYLLDLLNFADRPSQEN